MDFRFDFRILTFYNRLYIIGLFNSFRTMATSSGQYDFDYLVIGAGSGTH